MASLAAGWRSQRRSARALRRAVGLLLVVLPLGYVAHMLVATGPGLLAAVPDPRYELLAAALGLYAFCTAVGGLLWREVLRVMGHDPGLRGAMRQHLLSTPARYLPSMGGQSIGKIALAARGGIPARDAAAASVLELGVICASGLLAGLMVLPLVGSLPASLATGAIHQLGLWPAIAYSLAVPLALGAVVPHLLAKLAGQRPKVSYLRTLTWLVGMALNWLLVGLAVFTLAGAAFPIGLSDLPACQLAVAASMLAGLLAVTPLGLGVREGVLTGLLGGLLGPSQAALLAVGWRLLNVAADGLCFVIAVRLAPAHDSTGDGANEQG